MDIRQPITGPETFTEFLERTEKERAARLRKGRWGDWYLCGPGRWKYLGIRRPDLHTFNLTLENPATWFGYIRRDEPWLQRGDLEDLLAAFDDIFGDSWFWEAIYRQKAAPQPPQTGSPRRRPVLLPHLGHKRGAKGE